MWTSDCYHRTTYLGIQVTNTMWAHGSQYLNKTIKNHLIVFSSVQTFMLLSVRQLNTGKQGNNTITTIFVLLCQNKGDKAGLTPTGSLSELLCFFCGLRAVLPFLQQSRVNIMETLRPPKTYAFCFRHCVKYSIGNSRFKKKINGDTHIMLVV